MKFLAQLFFRITLLPITWLIYRPKRIGLENVPTHGGVLLVSNHVSYIDSFIIYLTSPRPVRFIVMAKYAEIGAIGWFLKLFGAIPIRQSRPKEAILKTVEALQEGDLVCIFPEGELTRTGMPGELKKGFELIVRKAKRPVVPVYMDGLWPSIFSFERDCYFKKWPKSFFCPLQVAFGKEIPAEEATRELIRERLWETSIDAFDARRELEAPLETAVVRALKKGRKKPFLIEQGKRDPRIWTRSQTLGLATALARRWMSEPPEGDRVGIMLPPGPTPNVIGLGLFLAGKVPVYLPFTMEGEEMEKVAKSVAPLGIQTIISSKAFIPHFIDYWPGEEATFIDMATVLASPGSGVLSMERMRAALEPARVTNWRLDFAKAETDREAWGMIPKPGEPAEFLTSRQLFRNALQINAGNYLKAKDVLFSEAAPSTAAGSLYSFWAPLLASGSIVSRSFSLREDSELLAKLALDFQANLLVGEPSFFKKIKLPLEINSLRSGRVFGEIHRFEIEDFEEKTGLPLCRGSEFAGRIVAISMIDPNQGFDDPKLHQQGRRPDAVGRLLPGLAARIDDDTHISIRFGREPGSPDEEGQWQQAGVDASIDEENFLYFTDLAGIS